MKKLLPIVLSLSLAAVLVGCGGAPSQEAQPEESTLETAESELLVCGFSCPSGHHPASYSCSFSCGSCGIGVRHNQTDCQPNSGSFFTCGTACPSGWHPDYYTCTLSCGDCGPGVRFNQAYCQPNSGSFATCGACPAGWKATSTSCSTSCGDCGPGAGPNRSVCVPL